MRVNAKKNFKLRVETMSLSYSSVRLLLYDQRDPIESLTVTL